MPSPAEPMLRRFYFVALRDAAHELWGPDAVRTIVAALPPEEREESLDESLRDWCSERLVIAWGHASWEGPARRDRATMNRLLQRHVDLGFGRIRRMLLRLASPERLFEKLPDFWRHDHTHGVLDVRVEGRLGVVSLREHPYSAAPQMRAAVAEIFRHTVQLMRARKVTETHALDPTGALVLNIRWE